jgi:predicted oxidoreductase
MVWRPTSASREPPPLSDGRKRSPAVRTNRWIVRMSARVERAGAECVDPRHRARHRSERPLWPRLTIPRAPKSSSTRCDAMAHYLLEPLRSCFVPEATLAHLAREHREIFMAASDGE